MKLPETPFTTLYWDSIAPEEYPGTTGTSHWRTFNSGALRVRIVDYGPDYLADHWCERGHVLHVVSGDLTVELADGREVPLTSGTSFCVSDNGDAGHRVRTHKGCRVFIVD